ncbi:hypothetical protein [Streptomyces chartreusis]|uniref:hypothetical protein n=1 Tax=Streptomyces chartreusis TaxID=1969 RepID=UPI00167B59D5|nr:hypothetical protein [Streptomyces chartreusis]GGX15943.1 hypothetical protein GCM10010321_32790 [Streptomyces chartreusis]
MFEIRILCDHQDVPRIAQTILGSVDATAVRRIPVAGGTRSNLLITAEHRSNHADCPVCDDGMTLWFLPDGTEQRRPCTGIDYEDLLAAGLLPHAPRREPWQRRTIRD